MELPDLWRSLLRLYLSARGSTLFNDRRIGWGILDLGLLRVRTLRLSITAGSVARAGLGGAPFLLPLLLQIGFGYDPFQSGLVTFLVAVGAIIIKPVMSLCLKWFGCRTLLLANSVVATGGLLGFLMFRNRSMLWLISPYAFLFGLFRSVQMTAMNALSYADIEKCAARLDHVHPVAAPIYGPRRQRGRPGAERSQPRAQARCERHGRRLHRRRFAGAGGRVDVHRIASE
jgi:hypothetical protein